MSGWLSRVLTERRRAAGLATVIIVQTLCAAFFVADVIGDFGRDEYAEGWHLDIEVFAALSLVAGIVMLMIELRQVLRRMDRMGVGLRAAQGDMAGLIHGFFTRWGLTPSEKEVAMLVLKGFDNEAIAGLRGVAVGTVRAQTARIYAKAGVDGRAQLFSVFMEELLAEPVAA